MTDKPFVVAGCPAKNRSTLLARWFDAMEAQSHRPDRTYVLLNDCDDDSVQTCWERTDEVTSDFDNYNTGDPGVERTAGIVPRYSIANLAIVRNEWIRRALQRWPKATHVWSVDSDALPDPNVLALLLDADLPVVAAVVKNSKSVPVYNFFCGWDKSDNEKNPARSGDEHHKVTTLERPFPVTMTGACVLIRRDVIDSGVQYAWHVNGEDVAWSIDAQQRGYLLAVHPLARTRHVQRSGEEWR